MDNYEHEGMFGLMKMLINEVHGLNRNLEEIIDKLKDIDWAIQHTD